MKDNVNKNDIRELIHSVSRKVDKPRHNDRSLVSKLLQNSLLGAGGRKPTGNEKLEILTSPYSNKFNIKGRSYTDKNPKVYVKDNNNCIKEFKDLSLYKQQCVLKDGLKYGKIYICYPPKEVEIKEDLGENVKIVVAKAVLKDVLSNYVDALFEKHANSYCVRRIIGGVGS